MEMYSINEKLFESILKKKFNSFVGNVCEITESIFRENLNKKSSETLIKNAIKKHAFNSMRDIQDQVSAFSKGINININFNKPNSK